MNAEENPGRNSLILQIFNKTKCVNLVSNVAGAPGSGFAVALFWLFRL
jgi:hypothetical protein